jgi:hypothetical protein
MSETTPRPMLQPARRVAIVLGICCVVAPTPSGARATTVTFGDSLGVPESIITPFPGCGQPCTLATTVSPEHLTWFRSPVSGTIVRWRIQTVAGSTPQAIALRVLAPVAGDAFTDALNESFVGAGTSGPEPAPVTAGIFTFPARLAVRAGDFIGLDTEGKALAAVAVEEESIRVFTPPPRDFSVPGDGIHRNYALLINTDVLATDGAGSPPRSHAHAPRAARILHLRVAPSVLASGRSRHQSTGAGHAGAMSRILYTDTRSATATFVLQRAIHGKLAHGRCLAASTNGTRHRPSCTLFTDLRSYGFTHEDRAGPNRVRFSSSVSLAPGSYRLQAWGQADGGTRGPTSYTSFRVQG